MFSTQRRRLETTSNGSMDYCTFITSSSIPFSPSPSNTSRQSIGGYRYIPLASNLMKMTDLFVFIMPKPRSSCVPQRATPVDCLRLHFAQTRRDGPIRCKRRASGKRSRIQLTRHRYRPRYRPQSSSSNQRPQSSSNYNSNYNYNQNSNYD